MGSRFPKPGYAAADQQKAAWQPLYEMSNMNRYNFPDEGTPDESIGQHHEPRYTPRYTKHQDFPFFPGKTPRLTHNRPTPSPGMLRHHGLQQPSDRQQNEGRYHGATLPGGHNREGKQPIGRVVVVKHGRECYKVVKYLQNHGADAGRMSISVRQLEDSKGVTVVDKTCTTATPAQRVTVERETQALSQIADAGGSPNINVVLGVFWNDSSLECTTLLEFCGGGTLEQYIDRTISERRTTDEGLSWHVLEGLTSALAMCHHGIRNPLRPDYKIADWNTIVHLDIKPGNVFMSTKQVTGREHSKWPRVVLGDFGCAITLKDIRNEPELKGRVHCGTAIWFPPELEEVPEGGWKGAYGMETDIYQMGCVVQAISLLRHAPDLDKAMGARPCGNGFSHELNKVIKCCMRTDRKYRPLAVQVAEQVNSVRARLDI